MKLQVGSPSKAYEKRDTFFSPKVESGVNLELNLIYLVPSVCLYIKIGFQTILYVNAHYNNHHLKKMGMRDICLLNETTSTNLKNGAFPIKRDMSCLILRARKHKTNIQKVLLIIFQKFIQNSIEIRINKAIVIKFEKF